MYFLGVGLIFLGLKWFEIGMVATWSWWLVLSPFALAVLWWAWADWSGYSKQQEVKKIEQRKRARIAKNQDALRSQTRRPR
jgi:small Trp-rich protein